MDFKITATSFLCLLFFQLSLIAQPSYSFEEIDSLVEKAYYNYDFTKALEYTEFGLKKAEAEFGQIDSVYAYHLNNKGFLYNAMRDRKKAIKIYKEVLKIRAKALGKSHPDYAVTLQNIASIYRDEGKFEQAEQNYKEAAKIIINTYGQQAEEYITIMRNLAILYKSSAQYQKSEEVYLQVLKLAKQIDSSYYANTLNSLAVLYTDMGRYHEAEPLLLEAKNIRKLQYGEDHPKYAKSLNNLARLYEQQYRLNQARDNYLAAIAIVKDRKELQSDLALYSNNLALLLMIEQKYDKAEAYIKTAQEIYANLYGETDFDYISTSNNLATLMRRKEEQSAAILIFQKLARILEENYGVQNESYMAIMNNIALCYEELGELKQAETYYLKVINFVKAGKAEKGYAYVDFLNNLGGLYIEMGDDDQAWNYLSEAVYEITEIKLDRNFNTQWKSIPETFIKSGKGNLSSLLDSFFYIYKLWAKEKNAANKQQQSDLVNLALDLIYAEVERTVLQKDQLYVLKLSEKWLNLGVTLLEKDDAAKALQLAEYNKSILLYQFLKEEEGYAFGNLSKALQERRTFLGNEQASLKAALSESRPQAELDSLRLLLNEVNRDIINLKKEVRQKFPNYAKMQFQSGSLDYAKIQGRLNPEQAILDYWVTEETLHIFYLDANILEWKQKPLTAKDLGVKIKKIRDALSNYQAIKDSYVENKKDLEQLSLEFYTLLLADFEQNLKSKKHLIVIPDQELFHIPFEVFLKEKESGTYSYLLEEHRFSYEYGVNFLLEERGDNTDRRLAQIIAFAAEYTGDTMSLRSNRLPLYQRQRAVLQALPAVKTEVEGLERMLDGRFLYGIEASESNFKQMAGDYAVIHLAMHGLLNESKPLLSALAFTEDGDSLENNFLQAYEIAQMDLKAELVVLSACETAYGQFETGNAVASLARSFMYADVSSLLVSLWQVNDASTSQIMQSFYKYLANGEDKARALQLAKLDYLEFAEDVATHPAFWSAFVLIGDASELNLKKKSSFPRRYLLFGGLTILLLILLGRYLFLKKKR
jgi:CHAT domain-containing protein/tetratricopeptide (TPR) repeat protein